MSFLHGGWWTPSNHVILKQAYPWPASNIVTNKEREHDVIVVIIVNSGNNDVMTYQSTIDCLW